MTTYRGDYFCTACGSTLALHYDEEDRLNDSGRPYRARVLFLVCPTQYCPQQYKKLPLPEA